MVKKYSFCFVQIGRDIFLHSTEIFFGKSLQSAGAYGIIIGRDCGQRGKCALLPAVQTARYAMKREVAAAWQAGFSVEYVRF